MALIKVKLPSGEIQKVKVPDDWDQSQIEAAMKKHFPIEDKFAENLSKMTPQGEENPERTGVLGVVGDVASGLGGAVKGGINFAADLPNKLEKSGKYIEEHPGSSILHNAGQLAAETADIGKGLINAPYNLNQYLARKHLLPQVLGKLGKLIPHIPEDTGVEKALGLEPDKEKGDDLIRAIPDLATALAGGAGIAKQGKKLFKAPDLKEAIRTTQGKVNQATQEAGKIFDTVEQEVSARGISKVPIEKDLIKTAESFLAKTPANKEMLRKAKTGDYEALRSLQADLRVKGEKALSSALSAENKMGEEILSTRDQVNKSIQDHFENTGHKDLAEMLNQARKDYKGIQKTYFSTPALAKVFGKSQKVPKNPMTLLTEESAEMKRFFKEHPEMQDILGKALSHEKKIKTLKKVAAVVGTGATGGATLKILGH